MTNNQNVNTKSRVIGIEYAGVGTAPMLIIEREDNMEFLPMKKGITRLENIDINEEE